MSQRFEIYAVSRDCNGNYWPSDVKPSFIKRFNTEAARDAYWNQRIVSAATQTGGSDYQYVKVEFATGKLWRFASEARYADAKLLNGTVEQFPS